MGIRSLSSSTSDVHNFMTIGPSTTSSLGILRDTNGTHRFGSILYDNTRSLIQTYLRNIGENIPHPQSDDELLAVVANESDLFSGRSKFVHHLMRYLNRHWIKREVDEGKRVYDIFQLQDLEFKTVFIPFLDQKARLAVLRTLKKQPRGSTVIFHPMIQHLMVEKLPVYGMRIRPIYLLTRQIDQLGAFNNIKPSTVTGRRSTLGAASQPQFSMLTHWLLYIGPIDPHLSMSLGKTNMGVSPYFCPTTCELRVKNGCNGSSVEKVEVDTPADTADLIGFTTCSNTEIAALGKLLFS